MDYTIIAIAVLGYVLWIAKMCTNVKWERKYLSLQEKLEMTSTLEETISFLRQSNRIQGETIRILSIEKNLDKNKTKKHEHTNTNKSKQKVSKVK